ncbi:MAG: mannose-1-phosphate guanylyltransferase [Cytophagaceae bacterium]|nr:mannose-1-phosphate guanylyltransferase [Gemmatimonadaceae bacterium]
MTASVGSGPLPRLLMSFSVRTPPTATPAAETGVEVMTGELPASQPLLGADAAMWAVVLAGGIGSRFWPLSSPTRPKQLLRLLGDEPMIEECVGRLDPLIPAERVLVVTSADIASAIRAAIPSVPAQNVLVEPRPLGTAAAVAYAAQEVTRRAGPDTLVALLHADIAVSFPDAFRHTLSHAGGVASRDDVIVTVGCAAVRADPAFGYAVPAASLSRDEPFARGGAAFVSQFVEKPTVAEAAALIERKAVWHTGVCVWRTRVMLNALRRHTPEVASSLDALAEGSHDTFFGSVQSTSIERGLFERSDALVVVPGEFGWDDVGTWASLRRARDLDDDGNGGHGSSHFFDSSGNIVHAEGSDVVLFGVDNLLVVTIDGITFVTTVDRATDLRPLLDRLPPDVRSVGGKPEKP